MNAISLYIQIVLLIIVDSIFHFEYIYMIDIIFNFFWFFFWIKPSLHVLQWHIFLVARNKFIFILVLIKHV